jgi:hypothetical protein
VNNELADRSPEGKRKRRRKSASNETFRRCRLGELRRLFRDRYGPYSGSALPDDDAGRGDLHELLLLASMAFNPDRHMRNIIGQHAPWMTEEEAEQVMDDINRTPTYLRKPSARTLGDRLRLTSEERHRCAIRTIKPFDRTDAELAADRKAKDNLRKWRKRRATKKTPREAWLANSLSRTKPWERQKPPISRRQWERNRKAMSQVHVASVSAVKLTNVEEQPATSKSQARACRLALGAAPRPPEKGEIEKGLGRSLTAKPADPFQHRKAARG